MYNWSFSVTLITQVHIRNHPWSTINRPTNDNSRQTTSVDVRNLRAPALKSLLSCPSRDGSVPHATPSAEAVGISEHLALAPTITLHYYWFHHACHALMRILAVLPPKILISVSASRNSKDSYIAAHTQIKIIHHIPLTLSSSPIGSTEENWNLCLVKRYNENIFQ